MAEVSSPLTTVARKRRREAIQTKRAVHAHAAEASPTPAAVAPSPAANGTSSSDEALPPKKRKIPVEKEISKNGNSQVPPAPPPPVQVGATSVPDPTATIREGVDTNMATPATTAAAVPNPSDPATTTTTTSTSGKNTDKKAAAESKKSRAQIQYNPGVPMSKEQLAAWRREMRRMRNRESAAASRQKIRDRIECLEEEVSEWKAKYDDAMRRLTQTEQALMDQRRN